MKRIVIALGLVLAAPATSRTPENCRKALLNMQHLLGTDNLEDGTGRLESEIRRCRGGSTKESVECAMNATTLDELKKCEFTHVGSAKPRP